MSSEVVDFEDGRSHSLMVWRTCDTEDVDDDRLPTPWSGLWVGELMRRGEG